MLGRLHTLVDVQDPAVGADNECPAFGIRPPFVDDPVRFGNVLAWIAKDRVIQFQFLREFGVVFDGVTARGEIGNVELLEFLAALTERQTFLRSAAGKGFGEPGDQDCPFAFVVRQFVRLAVAALQFEGRRLVADLEICRVRHLETSCARHERRACQDSSEHDVPFFLFSGAVELDSIPEPRILEPNA